MVDRGSLCELSVGIKEIGRRKDLPVRVVDRLVAVGGAGPDAADIAPGAMSDINIGTRVPT